MRKALSLVLSILLAVCMLPQAAFAEDGNTIEAGWITLSADSAVYSGSSMEPTVTVNDGTKTLEQEKDYSVSYEAGSGSALTEGKPVNAGSYFAVVKGEGAYSGTEVKKQFTITRKEITEAMVEVYGSTELTYTGSELKPEYAVKDGETTLVSGRDYTAAAEADTAAFADSRLTGGKSVERGAYKLAVSGKGNYSGTAKKDFTIRGFDITGASVTADAAAFTFTSKVIEPKLTVKVGNMTLREGTDFDVIYTADTTAKPGSAVTNIEGADKAVDPGAYIATVRAKEDGFCTGTAVQTVKFAVSAADFSGATVSYEPVLVNTDITLGANKDLTVNEAPQVPETKAKDTVYKAGVTVKKGNTVIDPALYDVTASVTSDNNYVLIRVIPKTSMVPAGSVAGPVLQLSRKITRNLNDNQNGYKIQGTVRTSDGTYSIADQVYSGTAKAPAFYVVPVSNTNGSTAGMLVQGTDYTVSYDNNINVGSATVIVTGIGKYSGTISTGFEITPKSMSYVSITAEPTIQRDKPKLIVKDGTAELKEDYDYTVSYNSSTIGSGRGTVTITGKGNYAGTASATFNVIDPAKNLAAAYLTHTFVPTTDKTAPFFNGYSQARAFTVKAGTTDLTLNYDYKVEYRYKDAKGVEQSVSEPVLPNDYDVYIVGLNTYGGSRNLGKFTVRQLPFESATYNLYTKVNITPNGEKQPAVSMAVAATDFELKEKTDYILGTAYINKYTGKGTITITSTGTGALAPGSVSVTYDIASNDIAYCNVQFTGGKNSVAFTGNRVTVPDVVVYDGNTKLVKGTNYTVTYGDNELTAPNFVECGVYKVNVKGCGYYTGTNILQFEITGTDISGYTASISKDSYIAAGTDVVLPTVNSVKKGNVSQLTTRDYTVSYQNASGAAVKTARDKGIYYVVISANPARGYTGEIKVPFEIVGQSQKVTASRVGGVDGKAYLTSRKLAVEATATGTGNTFSFESSDPDTATVDETGKITPHAIGRTYITVTADGGTMFKAVQKSVEVNIYPKRGTLTKNPWSPVKRQVKVRFNTQQNTTKYQIRYSRYSDFRTCITKTYIPQDEESTTQTETLKGLTSGRTYYVKVRSYVEVEDRDGEIEKIYGVWSKPRTVVCR